MIYKLRDLLGVDELGGTMRLGRYACELAPGSVAERIYGASLIYERHRHRFEFNCLCEPSLTENGMRVSGRSPDGKFVEIAELPRTRGFLCSFIPSSSRVRCGRTALCELRRSGAPAQDGHSEPAVLVGSLRRRVPGPNGAPCLYNSRTCTPS